MDRVFPGATIAGVDERTRKALTNAGFGVLTEIDVKATMKKKPDLDMPGYLILGACNPTMAHQAIRIERKVGAMLHCYIILRETGDGVELSAIDPVSSMAEINNQEFKALAGKVRTMLLQVVGTI